MCPIDSSSIEITELDLVWQWFLYNNVFNDLLNDVQYNLAFIRHIDMYSIYIILICYILVMKI